MNYIVYHRKDLDGTCSCGIAYKYLKDKNSEEGITLLPHDYGDPTEWLRKITASDAVYLVDISLSREDWARLLSTEAKVTWIDHHVTAIQDYLGSGGGKGWKEEFSHLPGMKNLSIRLGDTSNKYAACYLTWQHFYPKDPVPSIVQELSNFDIWDDADKERWDSVVMPIQHLMQFLWTDPKEPPDYAFRQIAGDKLPSILGIGAILYKAHRQKLQTAAQGAFEDKFQDLPAILLNSARDGSLAFEGAYDPAKHKIMVSFSYDGQNRVWKIGLYSTHDDVHCGKLAKLYGGGGHKGSAGFSTKKITTIFPKLFN